MRQLSLTFNVLKQALSATFIALLLIACSGQDSASKEHCIDLPDNLGTLSIRLDTTMVPTGHWIHSSDETCGEEMVWGFSQREWPIVMDTSYLTIYPDTMYHLMLRMYTLAMEICGGTLNEREWLDSRIFFSRLDRPDYDSILHGSIYVNDSDWSYEYRSFQQNYMYHDVYECYGIHKGRAILFRWERIAQAEPTHALLSDWQTQFMTLASGQ